MASEASVRSGLSIRKDSLKYQGMSDGFPADVGVAIGPTPGCIDVDEDGVNVDFSQLTTMGLAEIINLSTLYWVIGGAFDEDTNIFLPLYEWLPGEGYVCRFYRYLGQEQGTGTGTGASGSGVRFRLKAVGGSAKVVVNAFNK